MKMRWHTMSTITTYKQRVQ